MNLCKKLILNLANWLLREDNDKIQYANREEQKTDKSSEYIIIEMAKEAYDIWLSKYMDQGGEPTCFYNFNRNFSLVEKDCNTGKRYGAESVNIICLNGSNVRVGGHCVAFVVTKENEAIVVSDGIDNVSIYRDYKYVSEDPILIDLPLVKGSYDMNDIIFPQSIYRDDITKMIGNRYESYVAAELINYNEFPQHIRDLIKSNLNLYNRYLDFLLSEFDKKFDKILFYIRKYMDPERIKICDESRSHWRSSSSFNFNFNFLISQLRLSIEEKEKLIIDLALNPGFNYTKK